jgi:outer membrane biosynthesis protein TonB
MSHRRHRWFLLLAAGLAATALLISKRHPAPQAPPPEVPETSPAPGAPPQVPETSPAAAPLPASRVPETSPAAGAPAPRPASPSVTGAIDNQARNETQTMARIREAVRPRPDEALALLDALDQADPTATGALAEERAALRVDALVSAQRIGVARDAAEEFLRRYPHSPRAQHIEMLTGVHPRPTDPTE